MKVLAIIPARGGSKGLPGKNIRLLNGKPLIEYTIATALDSADLLYKIIVSTDDVGVAKISSRAGAEVPFIRPNSLATDESSTLDVLKHALDHVEFSSGIIMDWVLILQPTSPLRTRYDIEAALTLAAIGNCDSVVSVRNANSNHPFKIKKINTDGFLVPFVIGSEEPSRRQDLSPTVYQRNGAIYLVRRNNVIEGKLFGGRTVPYIMPAERSVDIDNFVDFKLAEILMTEFKN